MQTIIVPQILLPDTDDFSAWAVNACDQFTSDENYWKQLESRVSGKLSALNLIFPEIYLKDNPSARIAKINAAMREYLDGGVFRTVQGLILVERTTVNSGTRTGIVLAIDLEDYSYEKGAKTPVRSTEATITERIPPRVEIRKNAPIELPHAMLLYDDKCGNVLKSVERGRVLYDFDLNMDGGHVKGTLIRNSEEVIKNLYALKGESGMLFAVGDGNHSLATAKTCWENIKSALPQEQRQNHPARFALCEVVNIFDPALKFEPIHRYVKTERVEEFEKGLKPEGGGTAYIVKKGNVSKMCFNSNIPDGIRMLDDYISGFIKEYGGETDYIHGVEELKEITKSGGIGIALPAISKDDFFSLIIKGGNLPRKTFSMGEGNEKRYYIEAKKIIL